MYNDLSSLLYSFPPIVLEEMDQVKLLDRVDTKFVFSYHRLPGVLKKINKFYKVLDVNGIRQNRYETLYFDTPDYKLYLDHHNGRTNRYKIRYRKYTDSDIVFFEVKHKNNKGRTIKSRVKRKNIHEIIEGKALELVHRTTPLHSENLEPKLWVNYSRITLVNKRIPERLTLDIDLHFKNSEQEVEFKDLVIAEVKQEKIRESPFINLMRANHLRQGSISKYCFGVTTLIGDVKKNHFKQYLSSVYKICNEKNIKIPA